MFATIIRTDAAQIARDGKIFADRINYGIAGETAARLHAKHWAESQGVIAPTIVITETADAPVPLGTVADADGGELHSMLLSFSL